MLVEDRSGFDGDCSVHAEEAECYSRYFGAGLVVWRGRHQHQHPKEIWRIKMFSDWEDGAFGVDGYRIAAD